MNKGLNTGTGTDLYTSVIFGNIFVMFALIEIRRVSFVDGLSQSCKRVTNGKGEPLLVLGQTPTCCRQIDLMISTGTGITGRCTCVSTSCTGHSVDQL